MASELSSSLADLLAAEIIYVCNTTLGAFVFVLLQLKDISTTLSSIKVKVNLLIKVLVLFNHLMNFYFFGLRSEQEPVSEIVGSGREESVADGK